MRIGVLTYHSAHNYGAFLQAYALSNCLKRLEPDSEIEIIDYNANSAKKRYLQRIFLAGGLSGIGFNFSLYRKFAGVKGRLSLSSENLTTDDIELFRSTYSGKYDLIIVGSDEVWVTNGTRGFPNAYWLPGDYGCIKASYAASSRSDLSALSDEKKVQLKNLISDFSFVSVRDNCTKNELEAQKIEKDIHLCPDPVFLHDFGDLRQKGREILLKHGIPKDSKVASLMLVSDSLAKHCATELSNRGYKIVSLYRKQKGILNLAVDPFEWASIIAASDFMATSFFHGTCFSIKYDIPFLSIEERSKKNIERSKLNDLLGNNELRDHYFLGKPEEIGKAIDRVLKGQNQFEIIRDKFVDEGVDYLQKVLNEVKSIRITNK